MGRPWLMGLVLALLTVVFVSMIGHVNRMLYGPPIEGVRPGDRDVWSLAPIGVCLAALVVLGVMLPRPLHELLTRITEITR